MSEPITLSIPVHTESEANVREHWAKKAKRVRQQREAAFWAAMIARRKSPIPASMVIVLVRVAPRPLDGDNLQASMKAIRDGIAEGLDLRGDRESAVLNWLYEQRKGGVGEYKVEVRICQKTN